MRASSPMWRNCSRATASTEEQAPSSVTTIPDLGIMRSVGLAVAVANAVPEILEAAARDARRDVAAAGAVREFAELLLQARGEWDEAVERYVAERSVPRSKGAK